LCQNTGTNEITSGTTCSLSSERYKKDIATLEYGLDEVLRLRPVSFNYRPEYNISGKQVGFVSEEMLTVIPEVVVYDADGKPGGIDYGKLTSVLAKAIQELDAKLKELGPLAGVLSVVPGLPAATSAAQAGVESQCVTGDTRLRRRRKRVSPAGPDADVEEEFDEICIRDVAAGDEIQSLDEAAGRVVYSRVNALVDMGTQEVFELVTKSGRRIRTTSNHPFLARLASKKV
jgi:hypothetical protein